MASSIKVDASLARMPSSFELVAGSMLELLQKQGILLIEVTATADRNRMLAIDIPRSIEGNRLVLHDFQVPSVTPGATRFYSAKSIWNEVAVTRGKTGALLISFADVVNSSVGVSPTQSDSKVPEISILTFGTGVIDENLYWSVDTQFRNLNRLGGRMSFRRTAMGIPILMDGQPHFAEPREYLGNVPALSLSSTPVELTYPSRFTELIGSAAQALTEPTGTRLSLPTTPESVFRAYAIRSMFSQFAEPYRVFIDGQRYSTLPMQVQLQPDQIAEAERLLNFEFSDKPENSERAESLRQMKLGVAERLGELAAHSPNALAVLTRYFATNRRRTTVDSTVTDQVRRILRVARREGSSRRTLTELANIQAAVRCELMFMPAGI